MVGWSRVATRRRDKERQEPGAETKTRFAKDVDSAIWDLLTCDDCRDRRLFCLGLAGGVECSMLDMVVDARFAFARPLRLFVPSGRTESSMR